MKSSIRILFVILALCGMASHANANTAVGSTSCKQWLDRQNTPAEAAASVIWLNGYLSGANAQYGELLTRDFLKNPSKISIVDWTDAYCTKYPKLGLQESADALIKLMIRELPY